MDLEGADSRTTEGLCARKRLLAMATVAQLANWHADHALPDPPRPLTP